MELMYRPKPYGIWRTANPVTLVIYRILSGFAHIADGLVVIFSFGMLTGGFFMEFSDWFIRKLYNDDSKARWKVIMARNRKDLANAK